MSNAKHTPGPWHLNGLSVESADCWIASCDSRESNDNDCTNARLIAAAPDMLTALRSVQRELREREAGFVARSDGLVSAAIAKATNA